MFSNMKTSDNVVKGVGTSFHSSDSASDLNFSSHTESCRREAFLDLPLRKSVSCGFAWEPGVPLSNEPSSCLQFERLACDERCTSLPLGPAVASPFANKGPAFLSTLVTANTSRANSTPAPVHTLQQQQQQDVQWQLPSRPSCITASGPTTTSSGQAATAELGRRVSTDRSGRPPRAARSPKQHQQLQQLTVEVMRGDPACLLYAAQHPAAPLQHPFAAAAAAAATAAGRGHSISNAHDFFGASTPHSGGGDGMPDDLDPLNCSIRRTSSAPVPWQTQLQNLLLQRSVVEEEEERREEHGAAHDPQQLGDATRFGELCDVLVAGSKHLSASQLERLHRASTGTLVPLQQQLLLQLQQQQQRNGQSPRQQQQQQRPCITTGITTLLSAASGGCPMPPPSLALLSANDSSPPACTSGLPTASAPVSQSQRIVFKASAAPRIVLHSSPPPSTVPVATATWDCPASTARRTASRSLQPLAVPVAAAAWDSCLALAERRSASKSMTATSLHKRLSGDGGAGTAAAEAVHKRVRNEEGARYISHKERDRDSRMRVNQIMEQLDKVVPPSAPDCPRRRAKHSVLADTLQLIRRAYQTLPMLTSRACGSASTAEAGGAPTADALAMAGSLANVCQLLEASWSDNSDACPV